MNFWNGKTQLAVAILAWMVIFCFTLVPANRMAAQDANPVLEQSAELVAEPVAEPIVEPDVEPISEPGVELPQAQSAITAATTTQELSAATAQPEADYEPIEPTEESEHKSKIEKLKQRIKYKQFKKDQNPEFIFPSLEDRRNFLKKFFAWIMGKKRQTQIELIDPQGDISNADISISGQEVKINRKNNRQFRPGLYKIKAVIAEGDNAAEEIQEFEWGVLTVNTDKTIYQPNDTANLYFGVLDNLGHTICDAAINVKITDPENNASYLGANPSGECAQDNITDVPDYWATYQTTIPGKYEMEIIADNGSGAKELTDSFEVRENPEFDITRESSTRINPIAPYEMKLTIIPDENYTGSVIETVPADFEILNTDGGNNASTTVEVIGDEKQIVWQVNWEANQTYQLEYQFQAPLISPYIFLLGPLTFGDFSETRQWQIASDTPNWLTGFSYRKQINITGSAGAGTNYQVKLLVGETSGASGEQFDLAGHCTSFPNDIKFTDDDGLTELSYWVESTAGTTPNQLATVWVKVADDLGSNQSIYIYYGKSGQSSASSGDDTFLLFDDFNDASLDTNKWQAGSCGGSISEASGYLRLIQAGVDANKPSLRSKNQILYDNIKMEYKGLLEDSSGFNGSEVGAVLHWDGTYNGMCWPNNSFLVLSEPALNEWRMAKVIDGTYTDLSMPAYYFDTSWHNYSFSYYNEYLNCTFDGSNVVNATDSTSFSGRYIGFFGRGIYSSSRIDDVRVRKYAATEPAFASAGSEVNNVAPSFSVAPYESPTSDDTTPTNLGANVTFKATASDGNGDQWYLAICKTNEISAGTDGPPTCTGGEWAISTATDSASEATASYTVTASETLESYDWYAFACDKTSSAPQCSAMSNSGTESGNESPFSVNHAPTFSSIIDEGSANPGATDFTVTGVAYDSDTATDTDTVSMYVCKSNDFTGSACGAGGTWCSKTNVQASDGWQYRKQISLTGQSGAGTDYQVKLLIGETSGADGENFDLGGHATDFPNDIKFTDDDGATNLSYWVESTTGTTPNQLATVWVKVADDLGSNQNIYIYYGKSGQASSSSGDNTFIFFDDFETGNLSKWTTVQSGWSAQSTVKYEGNYAARGNPSGISGNTFLIKELSAGRSVLLHAMLMRTDYNDFYYIRPNFSGHTFANYMYSARNFKWYHSGWVNLPTPMSYVANQWYAFEIAADNTNQKWRWWINGASKGEADALDTANNLLGVTDYLTSDIFRVPYTSTPGGPVYLDQHWMRAYNYPEPAYSLSGSEEVSSFYGVSCDLTVPSPQVFGTLDYYPYIVDSHGLAASGSAQGTLVTFTVSNAAPIAPSSLGSSGYVDGSWQTDTTPTLQFTQSDSNGSDTVKYHVQIDDSADFGSLMVDYTSALMAQGATSFTVGQAAGDGSYTTGNEGQTLTDETSYYWRVMSTDNGDLTSSWATANSGSIAFKIDSSAPGTPSVTDDGSYTTSAEQLDAVWTSSDEHSGIADNQYCISTDTTDCATGTITDWTSTAGTQEVAKTGLTLSDGTTYYFHVKTQNNAGTWSDIGHSNGIMVDSSAPGTPSVTDDGSYTTFAEQLDAVWTSSDEHSGIADNQYCISTDTTDCATGTITDWTSTGATQEVAKTGLTLSDGAIYYFHVKTQNNAGTWSDIGHSNGIMVDGSAPAIITIDSITAESATRLTVIAMTAVDTGTGLHATPYWFREISSNSGGSSSADWQASTIFIDDGLLPNTQYTYKAKTKDALDNESPYSTGSSKYTLANAPVNANAAADSTTQITLTWEANSNPSGTEYYAEIENSSSNSGWTADTDYSFSGLTCGTAYNFQVKAKNGDDVATAWANASASTQACPQNRAVGGQFNQRIIQTIQQQMPANLDLPNIPQIPQMVSRLGQAAQNIAQPIQDAAKTIIETLFPEKEPAPGPEFAQIAPPPQTPLALQNIWNLIPSGAANFALVPLPQELIELKNNFTRIDNLFSQTGIAKASDLPKLAGVSLNLPGLSEVVGGQGAHLQSIARVSDLSEIAKEKIPIRQIFAQSSIFQSRDEPQIGFPRFQKKSGELEFLTFKNFE